LLPGLAHGIILHGESRSSVAPDRSVQMKSPVVSSRVMLALAFAVAFLVHLLLFSIAPMVTILMDSMRLSHTQFGFVFSVTMVSLILFRLPWGMLADRKGYVLVLRSALLLASAGAFMRVIAHGYPALLASQFLMGLGLAATMPCLSLIVRECAPDRLGFGTGLYVAGFAVGNAAALGATPLLLRVLEWRQVLLMYACVCALVCVAWWLLGRGGSRLHSSVRFEDFRLLLRDRDVWVLLGLLAVAMGCYDTLASWTPRVLEMKRFAPSLAFMLPLGFMIAGPVVGGMADRVTSRRRLVLVLGSIAALSVAGMIVAPVPLLLLCLMLIGFATEGILVITLVVPVQHRRLSPYAGSVVGLISSAANVGPLLMPVLFGYLIDVTGTYVASLATVALVAGVGFVCGSRVLPRVS
jgi:cyanate permease